MADNGRGGGKIGVMATLPVHDWTRVTAGVFHSFHNEWIAQLAHILNRGGLPRRYYALAEQQTGHAEPDLLTLKSDDLAAADAGGAGDEAEPFSSPGGGLALAPPLPQTSVVDALEDLDIYAQRQRVLTIRSATGDDVVAILEVASPGNKDRPLSVEAFANKVAGALYAGVHATLIDLFRPGRHDPGGLHDAAWQAAGGKEYAPPPGKPLIAAAYEAGESFPMNCYAEPFAVGDVVPSIPLYYRTGWYIDLPLAETYAAAYDGVPERWQRVLERSES